jgi:uncharacterized surface protein with fasciclin (FAS1) repeats
MLGKLLLYLLPMVAIASSVDYEYTVPSRKKGFRDKKRVESHHSRQSPSEKHSKPSRAFDHKVYATLSPTCEDDYVAKEHVKPSYSRKDSEEIHRTPSPSSKAGHSIDRERSTPSPSSKAGHSIDRERSTPYPSSKAGHSIDRERQTPSPSSKAGHSIDRERQTPSPSSKAGHSIDRERSTPSPSSKAGHSVDRERSTPSPSSSAPSRISKVGHSIDRERSTLYPSSKAGHSIDRERKTPSPSSKAGHSIDRERHTPSPSSKAGHSIDRERRTPSPTNKPFDTECTTLSPTAIKYSTEAPADGSFDTDYPTLSPTEASNSLRETEAPFEPVVTPSPSIENTSTDVPTPTLLPTIRLTAQDTTITVEGESTIYDVIRQEDDLATLVALVDTAGMDELLSNTSVALTLFAPINNALVDTPAYISTENWRIHLSCILLFHLLPYPATSDVFVDGFSTETLWGEAIFFTRDSTSLRSSHIVIYVNGFAFSENPILESESASNGISHKVRDLMFPTFMTQTLLDVVNGLESLTTLSELVVSVGAEEELTAMNRTMFAPSNEAFAAIPSDALSTLTSNPEALRTVLLYHLCQNVYPDFLLEDGNVLQTVLGPTLEISLVNASPMVNDQASIQQPNVIAGTGILHVIDTVLVPPVEPEDASDVPSDVPSDFPSNGLDPEGIPTTSPQPSDLASDLPSDFQSDIPSSIDVEPEDVPTTSPQPSLVSDVPSDTPSVINNLDPENIPTTSPQPSEGAASDLPSDIPSSVNVEPEGVPSTTPQSSDQPSDVPSTINVEPEGVPSRAPQTSTTPSDIPSSLNVEPEGVPSTAPQASTTPSDVPSSIPVEPVGVPSTNPQSSTIPSDVPSSIPVEPEGVPSTAPQVSISPSILPSGIPSTSNVEPEVTPTVTPQPTGVASTIPSDVPSLANVNETNANVTSLNTTLRQDEVTGEQESGAAGASWSGSLLMLLRASVYILFG